jgi:outer membrane protein TolC
MKLVSLFVVLGFVQAASAKEVLNLDTYLGQVKQSHKGYVATKEAIQSLEVLSKEGDLFLSPNLFGSAQFAVDKAPKTNPAAQGTKTEQHLYTLGVSQLTSFGLSGRVGYTFTHTLISEASPLFLPTPNFFDGKVALEVTQSLWRNAFGRETKQTIEAINANQRSRKFLEMFQAKLIEAEAETTYWRLALAFDALEIQKDSVERAKKFREWSAKRANMHLSDRADLVQAEAALKLRELELQSVTDELRTAKLNFNSLRGINSEQVSDTLEHISGVEMGKLEVPPKTPVRADVASAQEAEKAAIAQASLNIEKNLPNFELYGQLALNGRQDGAGSTITDSFNTDKPTAGVGVRFTLPLDFGLVSSTKEAYQSQIKSTQLKLQRKIFEQDKEWKDLNQKFIELKRRLELTQKIEEVQKEKYLLEKDRQSKGRSTTFLVLQFEQDLASSQFAVIRLQAETLILLAQMKTFSML